MLMIFLKFIWYKIGLYSFPKISFGFLSYLMIVLLKCLTLLKLFALHHCTTSYLSVKAYYANSETFVSDAEFIVDVVVAYLEKL